VSLFEHGKICGFISIAVIKAQLQIWVLTAMTVEKLGAMEYTEHPADILPIQHYFYIDPRGRTLAE